MTFNSVDTQTYDDKSQTLSKYVWVGGVIILCIVGAVGWYFSTSNSSLIVDGSNETDVQISTMNQELIFLGDTYRVGFTFPDQGGTDYTAESYEWVTGEETVENWTKLVTTHKLSPLPGGDAISASAYAENVAAMQQQNNAAVLETSIINTPEAAEGGVDIANPPFILIYVAFPPNRSDPVELNIQRIQDTDDGEVAVFIYAERHHTASQEELDTILASPELIEKRAAVLLQEFPY